MAMGTKPTAPGVSQLKETLEQGLDSPWMGIRPDLVLHQGAENEVGQQTYVVEDPVNGNQFELGESDFRLFMCLASEPDLEKALNKLVNTTAIRPGIQDVLTFVKMLQLEKLAVLPPDTSDEEEDDDEDEQNEESVFRTVFRYIWLFLTRANPQMHGKDQADKKKKKGPKFSIAQIYFFRIPIVRPDRFLTAMLPWVGFVWSKPFRYLYGVMALVGLMFTVEQIEHYFRSANYLFTFKGVLAFSAALYGLKVLHEFGHAFAAKQCGIFVRRMGIYMMFFVPLFYTDASDAWKNPSRKVRLTIGAAGVLVEIYVGGMALFFWSILADGILRSVMFYLSGAAIVSTLITNLSPFMRFDGYYVLMDYLRTSNLRPRSIALFKHYVRRLLVGWRGPKPEEHPHSGLMALFGLGCILYFWVIIFGIQAMVYTAIDEMLAIYGCILLFFAFILGPLIKEVSYALEKRDQWGKWPSLLSRCLAISAIVFLLFYPLTETKMLPSFFLAKDVAKMEAPEYGRIVSELPELDSAVSEGDVIVRVENEQMEQELKNAENYLAQVRESLKNMVGGGSEGGYRKWLLAEQKRLTSTTERIRENLAQLEIRAPFSGRVVEVNDKVEKGAMLHKKAFILSVAKEGAYEVRAFVTDNIYKELKKEVRPFSRQQVIIPDLESGEIWGIFREMLDFPVVEFPNNSLFDFADGPIVSEESSTASGAGGMGADENKPFQPPRSMKSQDPYYPLIFDVFRPPAYLRHGTPCFIRTEGETISIMGKLRREIWRLMAKQRFI